MQLLIDNDQPKERHYRVSVEVTPDEWEYHHFDSIATTHAYVQTLPIRDHHLRINIDVVYRHAWAMDDHYDEWDEGVCQYDSVNKVYTCLFVVNGGLEDDVDRAYSYLREVNKDLPDLEIMGYEAKLAKLLRHYPVELYPDFMEDFERVRDETTRELVLSVSKVTDTINLFNLRTLIFSSFIDG